MSARSQIRQEEGGAGAPVQERLYPGTDAITRGSLESMRYRRGFLVRYKRLNGYVRSQYFLDADQAHTFFLECLEDLRAAVRRHRGY